MKPVPRSWYGLPPAGGRGQLRTRTGGGTHGAEAGLSIFSLLISGMVVWGGLGLLADHLLGMTWLTPTGILVGLATAFYLVVKRFGSE